MWKCPVCEKENETLLCSCGFDGSRDYETLPTFCELGTGPIPAKAARKRGLLQEKEDLLTCRGCGASTFAYSRKQAAFRCTRCGRELDWKELSALPGTKPKAEPAAAVRQTPAAETSPTGQISGYKDYMEALEKLYRKNGKRTLTRSEIQNFLNIHDLPRRFGISVYDVEQDIRKIMEKNGDAKAKTWKKTINTYQEYLDALENLYQSSGKYMLTRAEIQNFLNAHDLPRRFGISVYDVEQDLRKFAKKSPNHQ